MAGVRDEEPAEGGSLLSWIWDGIVWRVRSLIDSAVSTLKSWANGLISALSSALNTLRGAWDSFRTYTLPALWEAIRNAGQTIWQTITNVYNNVTNYVTNTYNYVTQNITNVTNNITQNVTQVLGATREWVMGYVAGIVPVDFVRDPLGYIGAAFTGFIDAWVHGVAASFSRGLQKGLVGSNPGPQGPGESFMRGFRKVVDDEEGHVSLG